MSSKKLLSLSDAISRYIPSGCSVALGTAQETVIPFAAGHEIIRQKKSGLTLIGPISDMLFDQMVGAGCVAGIRAAWIGNVITGSGYNFRRAVENAQLAVEDHSILTLTMALKAGAMGVSYLPTHTACGSDLFKTNSNLRTTTCPFTGVNLTAVAAICPDVTIIHAQRADADGNAHLWGNMGVTREACLASRHIIITAEEIVSAEMIRSDPNRIVVPGFRVSAVVHAPWGAYPSPVPGYYNRDHQAFIEYRDHSRTEAEFSAWLDQWVYGALDLKSYIDSIGKPRLDALAIRHPLMSEPVDYGY